MRAPLPRMTYTERMARSQAKSEILLKFLGSGETFTTTDITAELLQIDRRRAAALLASLEQQAALKSESHLVSVAQPGKSTKAQRAMRIFGITPHGLAMADACGGQHFELGRTNSSWINHRIDSQRMRIRAESAGWTGWITERDLRLQQLKKVPDAVAVSPRGHRVAIECERHAKTPKRYAELIALYIQEIVAGKYHRVEFVCPNGVERLIKNSFKKVESVKVGGEVVRLEQKHFDRFTFHSLDTWPNAESEVKK